MSINQADNPAGEDRSWPFFEVEEQNAILSVLKSGKVNYWTGNEGRLFEKEFSSFIGASYGIALANGTVALELALKACGVGPGDEVIVPSRTYVATANAVIYCGAKPVFADVEKDSGNISLEIIKTLKNNNTKAVIPVHLGGIPCNMNPIMKWAEEAGIHVIEDCAQSHGASINGQRTGSFGHVGCFSFCQDKLMTTAGEGGMVVTSDPGLYRKIWEYKDHGKNLEKALTPSAKPGFKWLHEGWGTNARMSEVQSAVGRIQLKKLPNWIRRRRQNAKQLDEAFRSISLVNSYQEPEGVYSAYYKYYTVIDPDKLKTGWSRSRILDCFCSLDIEAKTGSCCEIYREKAFASITSASRQSLPNSRFLQENSLMFEIHPGRSIASVSDLASKVKQVLQDASIQASS